MSVAVNPPKTPVTEGSNGLAPALMPNVCKMPGPPAPFVPTPLPNLGRTSDQLSDGSTTVLIEGCKIAIGKAYFYSSASPDMASKGTGGGVVSSREEGKTQFIAPGSMDVKVEGKNVHLLGEDTTNNGGSPANTTGKEQQTPQTPPPKMPLNVNCEEKTKERRWDDCMVEQLCAMVKAYNESKHEKRNVERSPSHNASKYPDLTAKQRVAQNAANANYTSGLSDFSDEFDELVEQKGPKSPEVAAKFHSDCQYKKWLKKAETPVRRSGRGAMNPDHAHPAGLGGPLTTDNLKWADARVNRTVGPAMDAHDPKKYPGGIAAHKSCKCK